MPNTRYYPDDFADTIQLPILEKEAPPIHAKSSEIVDVEDTLYVLNVAMLAILAIIVFVLALSVYLAIKTLPPVEATWLASLSLAGIIYVGNLVANMEIGPDDY